MITQSVSLLPGISGEWFRVAWLQWITGLPMNDCCLSFGTTFSDPRLKIANGVYLGRGCDVGYVSIDENCIIGSGVHILSGLRQHSYENTDVLIKNQNQVFSLINIGADCWIGNGSIIAANIGKKCIIGAGSVVVKDLPNYAIAVGNPAKIIKFRKEKY